MMTFPSRLASLAIKARAIWRELTLGYYRDRLRISRDAIDTLEEQLGAALRGENEAIASWRKAEEKCADLERRQIPKETQVVDRDTARERCSCCRKCGATVPCPETVAGDACEGRCFCGLPEKSTVVDLAEALETMCVTRSEDDEEQRLVYETAGDLAIQVAELMEERDRYQRNAREFLEQRNEMMAERDNALQAAAYANGILSAAGTTTATEALRCKIGNLVAQLTAVREAARRWQFYSDPYHGQCADEVLGLLGDSVTTETDEGADR